MYDGCSTQARPWFTGASVTSMESADYRKLTHDARAAIAAAITEAHRLGHDEAVAAHLLLGLLTAGCRRVVGLLQASGMASVQQARDALGEFELPPRRTANSPSIGAELVRALKAAAEDRADVSASDLCAALLSLQNTATQLLDVLAVDRAAVLAQLRAEASEPRAPAPRMTPIEVRLQQAVERAELLASRVGRPMDDGDFVVALIDQAGSDVGRALANLGVTRELLEDALADTRPRRG